MSSCGTSLRGIAHQAGDIQNQRHATVPENGRAGDAFDAPIVRLHRLDHHLLLAEQRIDKKTHLAAIAFDDHDRTEVQISTTWLEIEGVMQADNRNVVAAEE